MSPIDLKRFHAAFFAESFEGLNGMEADLLRLEQGERDAELLNSIFRAIHSIKGAGGSLGFDAIAGFSHKLESFLDKMRKGLHEPNAATVDLLLSSIDCLRLMLKASQKGAEPNSKKVAALELRLIELQDGAPKEEAEQDFFDAPLETATLGDEAENGFRIVFKPCPEFFHTGNDPLRLFRLLESMGEFHSTTDFSGLPSITTFNPEFCYLSWEIDLIASATREQIIEVFEWVIDDCELTVTPLNECLTKSVGDKADEISVASTQTATPPAARPARRLDDEVHMETRSGSLHVSTEKVDDLINLVGELVITQTMLKQIGENFDMSRIERLSAALAQLERNTRDLQQNVMGIRMLPVSFAFGRFARLVRDVSMQIGKQVELKISGEQSELDKNVIEKLIDPLTHLVRNALDHGIETPEVRRSLGKSETATLMLHAEHKGGNIVIQVSDDGQGINHQRIRAKAISQNIIGENEELDENQLNELMFMPGFSTAEQVSDLSGRGVGLDVVRRNIAGLGGSLEIASKAGQGTSFIIRLPLTLAILDGMSVAVGNEVYILPLTFIIECVSPNPEAVKTISGQGSVVDVRGEYVPIVELGQLCAIPNALPPEAGILVLLEADGRKIALVVDALLGQDQVVIKSLDANYRRVKYIAGATILGEGRVVLILDVNALVRISPKTLV